MAANAEDVGRSHARLFATIRPAATLLGVSARVDPGIEVEVEAVAWRPEVEVVA